jgi:hypothetical protein
MYLCAQHARAQAKQQAEGPTSEVFALGRWCSALALAKLGHAFFKHKNKNLCNRDIHQTGTAD